MTWIKNNGTWKYELPSVNASVVKENSKNLTVPESKFVYIPTHNIHDVFEWYRLFKDAHIYNGGTYYDPKQFAIQGYFDNNRAASIKGWFPNLLEVKASSTDVLETYTVGAEYRRASIDMLTTLDVNNPTVDGVKILKGEKVLMKNQSYEALLMQPVDSALTEAIDNANTYYVAIASPTYNYYEYFKVGGELIIFDDNSNFYKDKITSVIFTTSFMEIRTEGERIQNALQVADATNGEWAYAIESISNGVYEYDGHSFSAVPEMYDEFKLNNQIIYTYLGDTNQNKQFYLRRLESKTQGNYGYLPTFSINEFIYSEGNAYLVKYLVDYDLNLNDTVVADLIDLEDCCECVNNHSEVGPPHPNHIGPFDYDEVAYRLLYLDPDVAKRIYVTDGNGLRKYNYTHDSDLNYSNWVRFSYNDVDGKINILKKYVDLVYGDVSQYLNSNITFGRNNSHNLNVTIGIDDIQNISNGVIGDNATMMNISDTGDMNDYVPFDECYIKLTIIDNTTDTVLLDQDVYSIIIGGTTMHFYRQLDDELVSQIKALVTDDPANITVKMLAQNSYNDTNFPINEQFKNSFVYKFYDMSLNLDGTVDYNGIRDNNNIKWANYGTTISDFQGATNTITHEIAEQYRTFFYDYSLEKYLNDYMDFGLTALESEQFTATVYNIFGSQARFGVEGSTMETGKGNWVYFGRDYKHFMKLQRDTLIQFFNNDLGTTEQTTIESIEWDEVNGLGTMKLTRSIDYPSNGEIVVISNVQDITEQSDFLSKVLNKSDNNLSVVPPEYKVDTAGTAYQLTKRDQNAQYKVLEDITGMVFKEFNEPRLMLFKRDKKFKFLEDPTTVVQRRTTSHVNINGVFNLYNVGDLVLVTTQAFSYENGLYKVDGTKHLVPQELHLNHYYEHTAGNVTMIANYELPYVQGTSSVQFLFKNKSTKKDPRLTMRPVSIARLGVDNKTGEWKDIHNKYDTSEEIENLLNVNPGVNPVDQIRFVDGLTAYNILNDIDGQGQYSWILNENVITQNAVVGCTQTNGPGTGTLIWYTGTWVNGTWCNGIWIQGTWKNGIWVNGTHNAYPIVDNYYSVSYTPDNDDNLSIWENGTWMKGTWNGGIAQYITWLKGTFNKGQIIDGVWTTGTFNDGTIEHLIWNDGFFYGGLFKTGIWYKGTFDEQNPTVPAIFGSGSMITGNYSTRAIWFYGRFLSGKFTTGSMHNASVFYSGEFKGDFMGGTFVSGTFENANFYDGVYLGGWRTTITSLGTPKRLTIDPTQYDGLLGLSALTGYVANTKHNVNYPIYLTANATVNSSNFMKQTFVNQWYDNYITPYVPFTGSNVTNTTVDIITTTMPALTYVVSPINESPFVCTKFTGNFHAGTWLNGYFESGNFYAGLWIHGFALNVTFGSI